MLCYFNNRNELPQSWSDTALQREPWLRLFIVGRSQEICTYLICVLLWFGWFCPNPFWQCDDCIIARKGMLNNLGTSIKNWSYDHNKTKTIKVPAYLMGYPLVEWCATPSISIFDGLSSCAMVCCSFHLYIWWAILLWNGVVLLPSPYLMGYPLVEWCAAPSSHLHIWWAILLWNGMLLLPSPYLMGYPLVEWHAAPFISMSFW